MEIQKVFSDLYGDERLYSVLLTEEEMYLFSEMADDVAAASIGTTAALGALGAGAGAGYGIKKGAEAIANRGLAKRVAERGAKIEEAVSKTKGVKAARKAAEKADKAFKKVNVHGGSEASAEVWEEALAKREAKGTIERNARKAANSKIKLGKASGAERVARKVLISTNKAAGYLKNNKKVAGALAAGTLATGAGIGYGVHKLHGGKKD